MCSDAIKIGPSWRRRVPAALLLLRIHRAALIICLGATQDTYTQGDTQTRTSASARTLRCRAMAFCVQERQPPPSGTLYNGCLRRGRSARRPSLKWQVCPGCLLSVLLGASCAARASFTQPQMHVCVCVCRQATVPSVVQRKHHQAAP